MKIIYISLAFNSPFHLNSITNYTIYQRKKGMLVAIGCDHAALGFKNNILQYLSEINFQYLDFGCFSEETTDYPIYGEKVANSIISNQCHAGLLFCGTGVGISLAANKVKGIRAVVCSDVYTAKLSKAHNNTNLFGSYSAPRSND